MSKGEQPRALRQSLQKSFATRWTPGRGDFSIGDFSHAPSPKNLSKNGFCPRKGVALLWKAFLKKKFSGAGEGSAVGASASTYSSAATGRGLTGSVTPHASGSRPSAQ